VANPPPKAYRNEDFLGSRDERELRILSEYLEPEARFERQRIRDTIVFFGSARFKDRETAKRMRAEASTDQEIKRAEQALEGSRYYEAARELSSRLTKWAAEVKVVISSSAPAPALESWKPQIVVPTRLAARA